MPALYLNLLLGTMIPAVLFAIAAALLARAREIDLSLDQQCFLVAVLQTCFFTVMPVWLGVLCSFGIIAVLQSLKLLFNRATAADSMVTSIAAGMVYMGLAFVMLWLFGVLQNPRYPVDFSRVGVGIVCLLLLGAVWIADARVAAVQRLTFPVRPDVGGVPHRLPSVVYGVVPAALLTTATATLMGAYARSVTPTFSSGLGILGATIAIVTYGRLGRSAAFGGVLGAIMIGPQLMGTSVSGVVQSFWIPMLSLLGVGAFALFASRT